MREIAQLKSEDAADQISLPLLYHTVCMPTNECFPLMDSVLTVLHLCLFLLVIWEHLPILSLELILCFSTEFLVPRTETLPFSFPPFHVEFHALFSFMICHLSLLVIRVYSLVVIQISQI